MHLVLKLWVESYNFLKSFFFSTLLEWCLVLPSFSCISLYGLLEHCTLISWFFCLFNTFPMYGAVFFQYTLKLLIKKKISWKFFIGNILSICQSVDEDSLRLPNLLLYNWRCSLYFSYLFMSDFDLWAICHKMIS